MIPDLSWWGRLAALLAGEAGALVLLAAVAARAFRPPQSRRIVWQAALLAVAVAWCAELAGLRSRVPTWRPPAPSGRILVVRTSDAPTPAASEAAPAATAVPASPYPEPIAARAVPLRWPAYLWAAGFGALALRLVAGRFLLFLRVRRSVADARPEAVETLRRELGLGPVRVLRWTSLRGPVAFGIARPTVALPVDFESRFDTRQRAAMLAHELAHLAGRDPLWLLAADLVCAFAWWHPAAWWARRNLQAASESAADAASALVPDGRVALAESLVAFGRELTASGGIGVGGSGRASELARRVRGLLDDDGAGWRALGTVRTTLARLGAGAVALGIAAMPLAWTLGGSPLRVLAQAAATPADETHGATPGVAPEIKTPLWPELTPGLTKVPHPLFAQIPLRVSWYPSMGANPYFTSTGAPIRGYDQIVDVLSTDRSLLPPHAASVGTIARYSPGRGQTLARPSPILAAPVDDEDAPQPNASTVTKVVEYVTGPAGSPPVVVGQVRTDGAPVPVPPTPAAMNPALGNANIIGYVKRTNGETVLFKIAGGTQTESVIRPVLAQSNPTPDAVPATAQILLHVRLVELFRRSWAPDPGLDWIFGLAGTNDTEARADSAALAVPGVPTTNAAGVSVEHLVTEGRWTTISSNQLAALVKHLETRDGIDLLSAPKVITLSGRQAQISISDAKSVVTGPTFVPASATNQAAISYGTLPLQVGPTIDLTPVLENGGFRIPVIARYTEFMGYQAPPKGSEVKGRDEKGKTLKGALSLPRIRVREATATATCRAGESIVLRGPNATNVVRTVDRVVGLGSVPLLGRLFTKESVQTNISQFYIVVEPIEVDPTGRPVAR